MSTTALQYLLTAAIMILVYLCGRAHGMAAGYRRGRDLWRPAYYRVYRQYLSYHEGISEGLLEVVSDNLKPFIRSELTRVEAELMEIDAAEDDDR